MSNQTTLGGDLDLPAARRPVAFELFVPVYGTDEPGDSPAERRRPLRRLGHRAVPGRATS